jgi:hypothetical protein
VQSSCELGNEPSGSIKCWEIPNGSTSCGHMTNFPLLDTNFHLKTETDLLSEALIFQLFTIPDAG